MKTGDGGLYILVMRLKSGQKIRVGKFPETYFRAGLYLYVGRAKQGLQRRLDRHMRKRKKLFWHIDYLLQKSTIAEIWIKYDSFDECQTAGKIKGLLKYSAFPQRSFGASDCRCPSHLLYLPEADDLESLRKTLAFERSECHED
jgi:sugar fermentation stimulation protein A